MDTTRFQDFQRGLRAKLPAAVDRILARARGRDCCLIGFLTTDDFYGCYLAWDTTGSIDQYFEWDQLETETDFRGLSEGAGGEHPGGSRSGF